MRFDKQIDTRGTKCPMPVLKTKKALAQMQTDEILCVLATDPASVADIAQFAALYSGGVIGRAIEICEDEEFFETRKSMFGKIST